MQLTVTCCGLEENAGHHNEALRKCVSPFFVHFGLHFHDMLFASCHLDRRDTDPAVANRSTGCRSWPAISFVLHSVSWTCAATVCAVSFLQV